VRCEVGEESCNICEKDDAIMAELEAQWQVYIREERER
jgi:hypothetical protein